MTWTYFGQHVFIVLCSVALAIAVGLPLGIICYFYPKAKKPIIWLTDVLQTIPALALLGVLMVFFGAGKTTVIVGIALYSLLPIVSNTFLGLNQVAPGIIEAALGMGMGKMYRLWHVELPLAFPVIFTGMRIAAVNAVGSAVFAAFVGGGGIGNVINDAIRIRNMGTLFQGTIVLMLIAVVLDLGMTAIEKQIAKRNGTLSPAAGK
ncbi:MAG: ABC transporter permease [Oscillospiraceae bacterium]